MQTIYLLMAIAVTFAVILLPFILMFALTRPERGSSHKM